MEDLLQFVPEEKRAEFEAVARTYVKADVDEIKKNISLFDRLTTGPIQTREKNLREIEFPKLLEAEREKLRKELNPEETPEQKRLRELEKKLADKEEQEAVYLRKSQLREKYKDLAPDVAEKLFSLQDADVDSVLEVVKALRAKVDELEKKGKYGNSAPVGGGSSKTLPMTEFIKLSPIEQAGFFKAGGNIAG